MSGTDDLIARVERNMKRRSIPKGGGLVPKKEALAAMMPPPGASQNQERLEACAREIWEVVRKHGFELTAEYRASIELWAGDEWIELHRYKPGWES